MKPDTPPNYDQMLQAVKRFVSNKLGIEETALTEKTLVEEDVGIAGLDTITFYEDYFSEFRIINPEDFQADKYITSENLEVRKILGALFSKNCRQQLRIKNNSLGHLARIAIARKWSEE